MTDSVKFVYHSTRNLLFLFTTMPLAIAGCESVSDDTLEPEPAELLVGEEGGSGGGSGGVLGGGGGNNPSPSQACADYGDLLTDCNDPFAAWGESWCNDTLDDYYTNIGSACATAFENFMACISAKTCEEFENAYGAGCPAYPIDKHCY